MSGALEFVWVVRRRDLFPAEAPQGFVPLSAGELERRYLRVIRERGFFVERRAAEREPGWKQPIPYILVARGESLLLLERLAGQSEERLHGCLSIGVGGHVNPVDAEGDDLLLAAARRELGEELLLAEEPALLPLGLLNDDRTEVGAVHVGLVYGIRTYRSAPGIRETGKMAGRMTPLVDLAAMCHNSASLESWSAEILRTPGWAIGDGPRGLEGRGGLS